MRLPTCILALFAVCVFIVSGCSAERIAEIKGMIANTDKQIEQIEQTLTVAVEASEQAKNGLIQLEQLASKLDGEEAAKLMADARAKVEVLERAAIQAQFHADQLLPALRDTRNQAVAVLDSAEKAAAAGGTIWDVILAGVGTAVPGLAGIATVLRSRNRWKGAAESSSQLAQDLKPLARAADPDATDRRIQKAAMDQAARSVKHLVDRVRKGAS